MKNMNYRSFSANLIYNSLLFDEWLIRLVGICGKHRLLDNVNFTGIDIKRFKSNILHV